MQSGFKPFNIYNLIDSSHIEESIHSNEVLKSKLSSPLVKLDAINLAIGGNSKQFCFLLELAQSGCISRPSILNGLSKKYDSIELAKFANVLTISVGRYFKKLYNDTALPLLTPLYTQHFLNHIVPINMSMQLSIGSDQVMSDDEISTTFYGARFHQAWGAAIYMEGLNKEYRKWMMLLLDVMSRFGLGFMHIVDLIQHNNIWLSETVAGSFTDNLSYDCANAVLLKEYVDQTNKETFDFNKFIEIHATGLYDATGVLSGEDIKLMTKEHKAGLTSTITLNYDVDYDSIENIVTPLYEHHITCDSLGLNSNEVMDYGYSLPTDFNWDRNFTTSLNELIRFLPTPSNTMEKSIYDYMVGVVRINPTLDFYDGLDLDTDELHVASCTFVGIYADKTESAVSKFLSTCDSQIHEQGVPFTYTKTPSSISKIIKASSVINSILGSVAMLTGTPIRDINNPY